MTNDRNALRAGVFILASIALILAIIVAIKGVDSFVQPMQTRQIAFSLADDIGGLRVGDDVRIGGFKVGTVRSVEIASSPSGSEPARILVTFTMPAKYILRTGSRVGVQGTLTGMSWVNFDDLGAGDPLGSEVALTGQPSPTSRLMAALSATGPEIQGLVSDIRTKTVPAANDTLARFGQTADALKHTGTSATALIEDVRGHLVGIVQKYHFVADRTGEMMIQVRDLIGDTKLDFRSTIAHLSAATATFKDKLPALMDQVNTILAKVDDSVESIQLTLKDIEATAANTREVTAAAKAVIAGNRGKFDGMIASMKATSDNLKAASAEIRRSPWRLLYKPSPAESGNLNLYDSARQFAEGATTLNDASLALRDALSNPQVDKAELQKLMQRVDESFTHFHEAEEKLWKSVRE